MTITELIKALEKIRRDTETDLPVFLTPAVTKASELTQADLTTYDSPVWGYFRLVIAKRPKAAEPAPEADLSMPEGYAMRMTDEHDGTGGNYVELLHDGKRVTRTAGGGWDQTPLIYLAKVARGEINPRTGLPT